MKNISPNTNVVNSNSSIVNSNKMRYNDKSSVG